MPNPGSPTARGFTLLELLVVLVVIALSTATVIISLRVIPEDRDLKQHIQRLATLIQLASEEALLQGRDFGLHVLPHGYEFFVYDQFAEEWRPTAGDELYRLRSVGEALEFRLRLEDRELLLKEPGPAPAPPTPQILIMSSGQLSPFELSLEREPTEAGLRLVGELDGTLRIEGGDDAPRG